MARAAPRNGATDALSPAPGITELAVLMLAFIEMATLQR